MGVAMKLGVARVTFRADSSFLVLGVLRLALSLDGIAFNPVLGVARVTLGAVKTFPPFRRLSRPGLRNGRDVARSPFGLGLAAFDPLEGIAVGMARVTFRALRTLSPFGRLRDGRLRDGRLRDGRLIDGRLIDGRVDARSPPRLGLTAFDPIGGFAVGVALKGGVARVTFRALRTLLLFGRMRDGRVVAKSPPGLGLTTFDPLEGVSVGVVLEMGVAF